MVTITININFINFIVTISRFILLSSICFQHQIFLPSYCNLSFHCHHCHPYPLSSNNCSGLSVHSTKTLFIAKLLSYISFTADDWHDWWLTTLGPKYVEKYEKWSFEKHSNLTNKFIPILGIFHICTRKDQQTSQQMYFMLKYHTRLSRLSLQMARFFLADWRFNRLPKLESSYNCCCRVVYTSL